MSSRKPSLHVKLHNRSAWKQHGHVFSQLYMSKLFRDLFLVILNCLPFVTLCTITFGTFVLIFNLIFLQVLMEVEFQNGPSASDRSYSSGTHQDGVLSHQNFLIELWMSGLKGETAHPQHVSQPLVFYHFCSVSFWMLSADFISSISTNLCNLKNS